MLVEHSMVERIEVENLIKYFISLEKKRHRRKMVVHPDPLRSRVRYWLNDIVDEMRKKSPASVQKWVDSIQIPGQAGAGPSTEPGTSSVELAAGQHHHHLAYVAESSGLVESGESGSELDRESNEDVLRVDVPVSTSDEEFVPSASPQVEHRSDAGSAMSIKSLLSKKTLLEKFGRGGPSNLPEQESHPSSAEQDSVDHSSEEEPRKSASLASIGKTKINEFYDKLSMNKAKYNLIKAKKIDIRNMLGASKENVAQQREPLDTEALRPKLLAAEKEEMEPLTVMESVTVDDGSDLKQLQSEASSKLSTGDIYEFSFDESFPKDEDLPDVSEDEEKENLEIPTPVYDTYLNPPKAFHRMGIGKIGRSSSENPRANNKRYNLLDIGRSFSEMNDDDNFVISECNNSCPNPSSLNTSSSINNSSSNILARFLKPSQVRGVDTEAFLRQQQLSMHIHENSVLGYRGLVVTLKFTSISTHNTTCSHFCTSGKGNPHIPPSMIVAKIMERFQENERGRLVRTSTLVHGMPIEMSTSAPTGGGRGGGSRNSSGPPSPILIQRHASLASEGRV
ncbi:AAEL009443-PA [Aedes aegypti]|uniref:AAEL009443-PA n=1 Tax=Aedes aegypti TaxID=7159 RepID=Q16VT2_AEDAE|nr:AAEL009443-PA [Aedes aegypti]